MLMRLLATFCWVLRIFFVAADCAQGDVSNTQEHCVHIELSKSNWQDAEKFCSSRGGHLASVHNAFDMSVLRKMASDNPVCNSFWTGGLCSSGASCSWTDDSDFKYTNWRADQPDPKNSCVSSDAKSGLWVTESCADALCFMCETAVVMTDCLDWFNSGYKDDGEYTIFLGGNSYQVYCDMSTSDGGWTVFQRRVDGSFEFWNRLWAEYKLGFGGIIEDQNYWLGLDALSLLSSKDSNVTLRVEMHGDRTPSSASPDGYWWNHYYDFLVGPESQSYPFRANLNWQNIVGNASTGWYDITCSNGAPFSTVDRINDPYKDCVTKFQMGGWWLHNCAMATLNGAYTPAEWTNGYGMFWIIDGMDDVIHPAKTRMLLRGNR